MRAPNLQLAVRDSLFDPDSSDRAVETRAVGKGRSLYRVFLYLEGLDLPLVRAATYHLHSSFAVNRHLVTRKPENPRCKLVIWTWGLFLVRVDVEDLEGNVQRLTHQLRWDRDLEQVPPTAAENG